MLAHFPNLTIPVFTGNVRRDGAALLEANGKTAVRIHSEAVAATAIRIAAQCDHNSALCGEYPTHNTFDAHGLESDGCAIAAYLHDIGAVISPAQMMAYAKEQHWPLDEAEQRYPFLLHQRFSARIAAEDFGITDERVLSAIACHTTLKEAPSDEDMILFVADKLAWDQSTPPPFYDAVNNALKASRQSTLMQPTSMQPTSMQPTSMQPTSMQPTSLQPTSVQATTTQPTSMQPTSVQPTTTQTTSVQTTSSQTTSIQTTSLQAASLAYMTYVVTHKMLLYPHRQFEAALRYLRKERALSAVDPEIVAYVQAAILPLYDAFDAAHRRSHANKVIDNALALVDELTEEIKATPDADIETKKAVNIDNRPINMNMVYVAAAYHDVGLAQGRDGHERASKACLLADDTLQAWFTAEEIRLMADAAEDHRASNKHEPRTLYGRIIAEADRDIDYHTILTRTIQYSLRHYPTYTREQHYQRVRAHIEDKYGESGYLTLYLDAGPNRRNLHGLRAVLREDNQRQAQRQAQNQAQSQTQFSADFALLYDSLCGEGSE